MNSSVLSAHVYAIMLISYFGGPRWLGIYTSAWLYRSATLYPVGDWRRTYYR